MRERCTRPKHSSFAQYGGRGVTICPRWLHGESGMHPFLCFVADIGIRPPNTSLDRIDVDKNYSADNCRWATAAEQRHNQRKSGSIGIFSTDELGDEMMARYWRWRDAHPTLLDKFLRMVRRR
jgi:hypothetical protein